MLIGYARVSTSDQDLAPQLDALTKAGCERTFSDKASGAKAARAGLAEAMSHVRAGDVLVVGKLDRLGRTIKGLVDLAAELDAKGVGFRSLTDGIDTSGTAGKIMFHMLAAFAEMERDLTRERTNAALRIAASQGRVGGRQKVMTADRLDAAERLIAGGMKPSKVATTIGVSVPTLYRHLPAPAQEALIAGAAAKAEPA